MLRVIMMGTGPFAVPTFARLLAGRHRVELLVTRPPRELHGKQQADVNPMRELARQRGLPIFEPESINTDDARAELARYQPDLFVVCDYGQILKPETLAIARLGGINLHASLLPKYRGAAPINWAVYHGEPETGDTVIHMSPAVDAGPAIAQIRLPIGPDDTAADLEPRLAELGAPLVTQAIEELIGGTARAIAQDATQATRAPRLKKTDGQVDWSRPAAAIRNQVRALVPWPKTHTFWQRPAGNRRTTAADPGKSQHCRQPRRTGLGARSGRRPIGDRRRRTGSPLGTSPTRRQARAKSSRVFARLSGAGRRAIRVTRLPIGWR